MKARIFMGVVLAAQAYGPGLQLYDWLSYDWLRSNELVRYYHPLLLPDVKTEGVLYLCTVRRNLDWRRKICQTSGLSRLRDGKIVRIC